MLFATAPLAVRAQVRSDARQQAFDDVAEARAARDDADEELTEALQDGRAALVAGDKDAVVEAMQRACQYRASYHYWEAETVRRSARL
jgi:hypothetical protein